MPKKLSIKWTGEIINSFIEMGLREISKKFNIDRKILQRKRNELGISAYSKKTYRDSEDGLKTCARCKNRLIVGDFPKSKNRWDGLAQYCKKCSVIITMAGRNKRGDDRLNYIKKWKNTKMGKLSVSISRLKAYEKRRDTYIHWSVDDDAYIRNIFSHRCPYCGDMLDDTMELEHFIPVKHGGKTVPGNMLYSCSKCNHGKGGKHSKMPLDWLVERYGAENGTLVYNKILGRLAQHYKEYKEWEESESGE